MTDRSRVTDYDRIADRFDRRYELYRYDGVRETLLNFLGAGQPDVLEVGCGTGHWLSAVAGQGSMIAGMDPSAPMLQRARSAAPTARLVRARAEDLPWADASFDRVVCLNALHHFTDRTRFFGEARRVLRSGGGLLTVGKDPHAERDRWWVYDYFPETLDIDRSRFAPVRILRGELTRAGFAWAESAEADQIQHVTPAADALAGGVVDPAFTSQLTVLTDEEFDRGVDRIRRGIADTDSGLDLVSDFRLFATVAWV